MLPVEVLRAAAERGGPRAPEGEGLRVLDLCAAPGSKATQLGAWLGGKGLLVANEPKPERARPLRTNLLRAGVASFLAVGLDGRSLGDLAPGSFDAVLVDAPCSAEGRLRKDPAPLERWAAPDHAEGLRGLLELQRGLLESGWRALRPGGCLVYATCTLNSLENEELCRSFLADEAAASCLDVRELLGAPGAGEGEGFLRAWPQAFDAEGFFVACFLKNPGAGGPAAGPPGAGGTAEMGLRPVRGELLAKLRAEASRMGFEVGALGELMRDTQGAVWLLPAGGLRWGPCWAALAARAECPGVRAARVRPDGGLDLEDELLLLAGRAEGAGEASGGRDELLAMSARLEGTRVSHNAVMGARASRGDAAGAEQALAELAAQGLQPNVVSFTTLVSAYGKAGSPEQAREAFDRMRAQGVRPNLVSYNALITAYAKAGRVLEAEAVLEDARRQHLEPNVVSYTALMKSFACAGDPAGAEAAWESMRAQRVEPNAASYNTLAISQAARGSVQRARELLQEMQRRRFEPAEALGAALRRRSRGAGSR